MQGGSYTTYCLFERPLREIGKTAPERWPAMRAAGFKRRDLIGTLLEFCGEIP